MDQYETWHAGRPRPWPHCVRWGHSSPPQNGAEPSNSRPISVVAKWLDGSRYQDATWYGGRPQPKRHCVTVYTQMQHAESSIVLTPHDRTRCTEISHAGVGICGRPSRSVLTEIISSSLRATTRPTLRLTASSSLLALCLMTTAWITCRLPVVSGSTCSSVPFCRPRRPASGHS